MWVTKIKKRIHQKEALIAKNRQMKSAMHIRFHYLSSFRSDIWLSVKERNNCVSFWPLFTSPNRGEGTIEYTIVAFKCKFRGGGADVRTEKAKKNVFHLFAYLWCFSIDRNGKKQVGFFFLCIVRYISKSS